jgi:hypothetical protein
MLDILRLDRVPNENALVQVNQRDLVKGSYFVLLAKLFLQITLSLSIFFLQ